ncbi:MAG: ABC transporter ATP-binding protein [Eubacteriales bacterium]
MIKLHNVSFSYQSTPEFLSVDQLDLHIKKGEIVVLCGRSGCGKTTVTRLINGLIPHFFEGEFKGEIWVDGKDVAQTELSDFAKTCGSMFQNPKSQFFNIDTTSELAFGCENLAISPEEIHSRMESTVQKLELNHLKDRNIFQLSGGEKQQIAMGSIHAATPDLYVLDEPSSNMDAAAIERLRNLILTLKEEGKTVVISEHRLSYLVGIAHRFLYFSEGKLAEEFTPSQLLALTDEEREKRGLRQLNLDKIPYKSHGKNSSMIGLRAEHLKCYKSKKQV